MNTSLQNITRWTAGIAGWMIAAAGLAAEDKNRSAEPAQKTTEKRQITVLAEPTKTGVKPVKGNAVAAEAELVAPGKGKKVTRSKSRKTSEGGHAKAEKQLLRRFVRKQGQATEKATVTWLGVHTSPVSPVVAAQLGHETGLYVILDLVVPESPAAQAGLVQYDILQKLDDQIIVNLEQLSGLVRSRKAGDKVKLTVLRGGSEKVLEAELGEHSAARLPGIDPIRGSLIVEDHLALPGIHVRPGDPNVWSKKYMPLPKGYKHHIDEIKKHQRKLQDELKRAQKALEDALHHLDFEGHLPLDADPSDDLKGKSKPNQHADPKVFHLKKGPSQNPITVEFNLDDRGKRIVTQVATDSERGTLRYLEKDGRQSLSAVNAEGKTLFAGPINTKEEQAKVPEEIWNWFQEMQEKTGQKVDAETILEQEIEFDTSLKAGEGDDI